MSGPALALLVPATQTGSMSVKGCQLSHRPSSMDGRHSGGTAANVTAMQRGLCD